MKNIIEECERVRAELDRRAEGKYIHHVEALHFSSRKGRPAYTSWNVEVVDPETNEVICGATGADVDFVARSAVECLNDD